MPIRTCLVTGKKAEQSAFFRFTVQNGNLVFDSTKRNTGRGGYVIPSETALQKLPHLQKKIAHFLKTSVLPIQPESIQLQIEKLSSNTKEQ